jgi:hypothetical protein
MCEHDDCRGDDDRRDQSHRRLRWALFSVGRVAGVAADESVAGAGHLDGERPEQQEADEQVHRDQLSDSQNRDPEDGEQQDQDRSGDRP